ncbi:nuclear transport factor 2 family protein [Daejeonella oryzae]|uniref:nuclear transport factor 2 family protein n=1 Tax=Daejeonella oryzae TaxID=1122943 RepID=UPI00047BB09C|nr:nuclear transport factor 2 family protein [Daejeonella oryzae]
MKKLRIILLLTFHISISTICLAQHPEETIIKGLENEEREAILKGDTSKLYQLMSPEIVVQNPENALVGLSQIMERIRTGKINYASFERHIERITFFNNVSIVMGKEVLIPQGLTNNPGKTITRRFTNIWIKEQNIWKLTARQATIVSIK